MCGGNTFYKRVHVPMLTEFTWNTKIIKKKKTILVNYKLKNLKNYIELINT